MFYSSKTLKWFFGNMLSLPKKSDSLLADGEFQKIFFGLLLFLIIPTVVSALYFGPLINIALFNLFVGAFGASATAFSAIKIAILATLSASIIGAVAGTASILIFNLLTPRLAVFNNVGGFSWNVAVAFAAIPCVAAACIIDIVCSAYSGLNILFGLCRGNNDGGDATARSSISDHDIPAIQEMNNRSTVEQTPSTYLGFRGYISNAIWGSDSNTNNLNHESSDTRQNAPSITQRVRAQCNIM